MCDDVIVLGDDEEGQSSSEHEQSSPLTNIDDKLHHKIVKSGSQIGKRCETNDLSNYEKWGSMSLRDNISASVLNTVEENKTEHCPETRQRISAEVLGNDSLLIRDDCQSFSQPVEQLYHCVKIPLGKSELVDHAADFNQKITSPTAVSRTSSDNICRERKRRKRTEKEVEAEQAMKQELKERKQQEKNERKKRVELEKQVSKFEREVAMAKKSKCEQNLFCIISLDLISSVGNLDELALKVFEERNIRNQLLFDGDGMRVCWKRRILEGEIENGEFVRSEKLMYEQFCILSINAQCYSEFKSAKKVADFVGEWIRKYPFQSPRLTVVVYGMLKMRKETVTNFVLELFERYRAQTRFILTVEEYAVLIAQMHRSIARNERHLEKNQPIVDIEKGITEGDYSSIVSDWWMKMLSQVYRLGADAQRTVATTFPNPHILLKLLKDMSLKDGMNLLANTKTGYGRRIGPVLARKIYTILTSVNGTEIIDEN